MKMHVRKPEPWVLPVTVVCLFLGGLIAILLRSAAVDATDDTRYADPIKKIVVLQDEIARLRNMNDDLKNQFGKARKDYNDLIDLNAKKEDTGKQLFDELNTLRMRAGLVAVEGPGIVIILDDSKLKTSVSTEVANALLAHDVDLMMLVNELRSAEAEAISINDQRVVATTAIRCAGAVVQVNKQPISPPFVIKAIGTPDVLYGAVNLPMGVLDGLRPLGFMIEVEKRELIHVAALTTTPTVTLGKPVDDKPAGTGESK